MKFRPVAIVGSVCAATLALSGCSNSANGPGTIAVAVSNSPSGEVVLSDASPQRVSLGAIVAGTIVLVADSCFGLKTGDGTFTLVLPPDSKAEADGKLVIATWGTFALGAEVQLGGGTVPLDGFSNVPEKCATSSLVAVADGEH